MVNDPSDTLGKVTHIILDEVHERDTDIDFLMVMLKHLMRVYNFKIILMSATFSTIQFANYFATAEIARVTDQRVYIGSK